MRAGGRRRGKWSWRAGRCGGALAGRARGESSSPAPTTRAPSPSVAHAPASTAATSGALGPEGLAQNLLGCGAARVCTLTPRAAAIRGRGRGAPAAPPSSASRGVRPSAAGTASGRRPRHGGSARTVSCVRRPPSPTAPPARARRQAVGAERGSRGCGRRIARARLRGARHLGAASLCSVALHRGLALGLRRQHAASQRRACARAACARPAAVLRVSSCLGSGSTSSCATCSAA
jgi:hypothetical protein